MYRIGHGFDVHPFVENRKLVLCGVTFEYPKGLKGHSDADVAIHALMDAILGALAAGDIGGHFPDTDPKYKDISSRELLRRVCVIMSDTGYILQNADITIHAEEPKISPYIDEMREILSNDLECDSDQINVKATTWEKLGFVGRKEGIAADAVVILKTEIKHGIEIDISATEKMNTDLSSSQGQFDFDNAEEEELIEQRVKTKGEVTIYIDGASRGNPGPSAAGGVIVDSNGNVLQEISMYLGKLTNNQAEYQALILALKEVAGMRPERVLIKMDSELVVKQITGEYRVKDEKLLSLFKLVKQQLAMIKYWDIEHIPREKNSKADALANKALDKK